MKAHILRDNVLKTEKKGKQKIVVNYEQGPQKRFEKLRKTAFSFENSRFSMAKGYNFDRRRWLWGAAPRIVGCISPVGGVHFLFWGANPRNDGLHAFQE